MKKIKGENLTPKMSFYSEPSGEIWLNARIMHPLHSPALRILLLLGTLSAALVGCQTSRPALTRGGFTQAGQGSYYADKFAGRLTASGVPYRPNEFTAAHNTLPFGTRIEVTNVRTGRSVQVVVNDRGPHVRGRIVDVSKCAARPLGLLEAGVIPVRLRVVQAAPPGRR